MTDEDEMRALAELSHAIDRLARFLCDEDPDDRRVEQALADRSGGQREAVAVALSYALRRREREGSTPINDRTVAALAGALRRLAADPDAP